MVFDRDGLRVLRAAYELALRRLRQVELLSESERERLAGAILELGWARTCRGLSLRGAETLIASEAFSHHKDASALALCAYRPWLAGRPARVGAGAALARRCRGRAPSEIDLTCRRAYLLGSVSHEIFADMAVRPILTIPDSRLRQVAEPVGAVDDRVRALADEMLETMYKAPGIGLAAPQIGVLQRIVVLDVAKRKDEEATPAPMVFVNPVVTWSSKEKSTYEEGCLSIPDYYEEVERPAVVHVSFLDRDGSPKSIEADGILATCLQHEIDHLNGVLFIDYISRLKRSRIVRKFEKAARSEAEEAAEAAVRRSSRG